MKGTASKNHRTTATEVTAELNVLHEDLVSTKTVQRELHKSNIHSRAAIAKPLGTLKNTKKAKKNGVMIIKPGCLLIGNMHYGLMSHPYSSQLQAGFMFGQCPRKPIVLNAWFQL